MTFSLRAFARGALPHAVVEYVRTYKTLSRLGVPSSRARALAFAPTSQTRGAQLIEAAVGAANGTCELNLTGHAHNTSLLQPRTTEMNAVYNYGYNVDRKVSVPVRTLDSILEEVPEISLLKIDVQGAEKDALAGASQTLRKTRYVLLEANFVSHYIGDLLFPQLHELMSAAGFRFRNISNPYVLKEQCLWADALYVNAF